MEERQIPELRPGPAPVAVRVLIPQLTLLAHRVALHVKLKRAQKTPAPPAILEIILPMWIINTGLSMGMIRANEKQVKNVPRAFQLPRPP